MRGFRSTLILLVVFLGLLGYIYFYESKRPAADTPEARLKVFTVEADTITELSVKAESGERSELRKTDGRWMLVQPEQQAVDESEVSSITSSLSNLEIQRVVDENPGDLKQYGLAEPRIEVGYKADGAEKRLLIGDKTATGGDLYAKLPDEKRVFLIAGYLDGSFNKTPFNLRDKAVLKFERDKVDVVEIASPAGAAPNGARMRFEKKPGEDWKMVRPVDARADVPAVEGVIGRLQSAQMKSIVAPDAPKPAEYGLDKPAVTITIGAASARHQLTIGKEAPDSAVYARESARPLVFTVDKSLVDDVKKPVDDFRDKDLFKFRSFNAERLELTRGKDTWVFEKSKDSGGQEKWKQVSPSANDVDSSKMDTLLMKVSNLRAKSFPEAKVKTGLEAPVLSVAARSDGKDERVVFGRSGDNVYASRSGDAGAAQLELTDFNDVIKALDDLNAAAPAPEPAKKP